MGRHRDERGLSNSVQAALLFPVGLGLFLALLQWAMVSWAEGSAIAAAQQGASVAAVEGNTAGEGRAAALQAAANGSLTGVTADVTRGARLTTATVTGRAVVVVWPRDISRTVVVTTERVTQS
ncbi:TadE/TadG family type IV pilus assembly protein [Tessaracoccus sp. MC1756]|uniref:TadE/TadG family type IV pilus assembly protein n=1 Tax=Tessaracoccus sp. MC1756 TaxID=2760311 RepID=UPI0015FFCB97|nr:TadE/TadG family type IV pilus assembly protein [Tessaracoccus sp. MC1756]MBB1509216.1 pilus assembly protein [Tessaracoccus sp. MC1756]